MTTLTDFTAVIHITKAHARKRFYRGGHRAPWSVGAKMGTLGSALVAILVATATVGIYAMSDVVGR